MRSIRQTVRAHLETSVPAFASMASAGKVAWENRAFGPPSDGSLGAREALVPDVERWASTGLIEASGIAQYEIVAVAGNGTEAAEDLAQSIAEALEHGTSLLIQGSASDYLRIDRVSRDPGRPWDDQWYAVPVVAAWRTYAQKT